MIEQSPRWKQGADKLYRPDPPYREGEVELCEGCARPMVVSARAARDQWLYSDCRPCGDAEDAHVMGDEA